MLTKNIILSIIVVIITIVLIRFSNYFINASGERKKVIQKRIYYVTKFTHFLIYFLAFITVAVVWNVELGVLVF